MDPILARQFAFHLVATVFPKRVPYGTDQWISAVGSSWAAIALSLTVDARSATRDTQLASNRRGGRDRVLYFSWPAEAPHTVT